MKIPTDFLQEYGLRGLSIAAQPTPSPNHPERSAGLPIEVLQSARRHWRLFPVLPHGKFASAKARIEEATTDLERLEEWACKHPGCNWGLATGQASGVFVLEVDAERGRNALCILCGDEWDWQQTLQSQAGDAAYAFFPWPAGRAMHRSGRNLAPGLSIRGEGDYVLIPPSAYSSGVSHAYVDPDAAIAAAPHWLLDSAFAGLEGQLSGKILPFANVALPKPASTARPRELSAARLLPFVSHTPFPPAPHARHRVYMSFQFRRSCWRCQFLEEDLQTLLPRMLNLATAEEVVALVDRGGGLSSLESWLALDLAIAAGRGGAFLALTKEQYAQLQKHCRPGARA